ncbi:MAG: cytochrome c biogenesis protein CcsA [Polyangiales bacterium]
MPRRSESLVFHGLVAVTTGLFLVALWQIFFVAPVELTMGIVQKIFYFHVPSAYAMYLGAGACLVGSCWYLANGSERGDAIAQAGGELAVAFGAIVLISGPLWARKAWGTYWTWDPRLTTTLLALLIYVAYVVLRGFGGEGQAEKRFAAALGVLGVADMPIIHFSVQKWSGQHPTVITSKGGGLDPQMYPALWLSFGAFTLLFAVLLWARVRGELLGRRLRAVEDRAIEVGVLTGEEAL